MENPEGRDGALARSLLRTRLARSAGLLPLLCCDLARAEPPGPLAPPPAAEQYRLAFEHAELPRVVWGVAQALRLPLAAEPGDDERLDQEVTLVAEQLLPEASVRRLLDFALELSGLRLAPGADGRAELARVETSAPGVASEPAAGAEQPAPLVRRQLAARHFDLRGELLQPNPDGSHFRSPLPRALRAAAGLGGRVSEQPGDGVRGTALLLVGQREALERLQRVIEALDAPLPGNAGGVGVVELSEPVAIAAELAVSSGPAVRFAPDPSAQRLYYRAPAGRLLELGSRALALAGRRERAAALERCRRGALPAARIAGQLRPAASGELDFAFGPLPLWDFAVLGARRLGLVLAVIGPLEGSVAPGAQPPSTRAAALQRLLAELDARGVALFAGPGGALGARQCERPGAAPPGP